MEKNPTTSSNEVTQYYSKWRECWVYFTNKFGIRHNPNQEEINKLKKHGYKLR